MSSVSWEQGEVGRVDTVSETSFASLGPGTVVGVDESTAFSWPTCDLCGNERLEQSPEDR